MTPELLRLQGAVQHYAWGVPAERSLVARLASPRLASESPSQPCAELWLGTHPNGPARVQSRQSERRTSVDNESGSGRAELLRKRLGRDLGFLFKVLSIDRALSIQVHPSANDARELHAQRPQIYKDANHKPEMALALTDFEALCGFRSMTELKALFSNSCFTASLVALVGEECVRRFLECQGSEWNRTLREVVRRVLTSSQESYTAVLKQLLATCDAVLANDTDGTASNEDRTRAELLKRLHAQHGVDVGVITSLLLNFVQLRPGEALFLAAGEPHAYLSGDIIESMACSDNVVRAGLTPKYRDVDTLLRLLTYRTGAPLSVSPVHMQQQVGDTSLSLSLYVPPVSDVDEFAVLLCELRHAETSHTRTSDCCELPHMRGDTVALVLDGEGCIATRTGPNDDERRLQLHRGDGVYLRGDVELQSASYLRVAFCLGANDIDVQQFASVAS
ncbi:MAG: hypothetical protein MHM6MM_000086 [Cercozoa sp. M6MM]